MVGQAAWACVMARTMTNVIEYAIRPAPEAALNQLMWSTGQSQPARSRAGFCSCYPAGALAKALDKGFLLVPESLRQAVAELVEEGGDQARFLAPDHLIDPEQRVELFVGE